MTLRSYIESECEGSSMEAAKKLNVSYFTVRSWDTGKRKPRGLYAQMLRDRGIEV